MFTVYIYVLDTLADWELGYVTAELNSGRFFVCQCSGGPTDSTHHSPRRKKLTGFLNNGSMFRGKNGMRISALAMRNISLL